MGFVRSVNLGYAYWVSQALRRQQMGVALGRVDRAHLRWGARCLMHMLGAVPSKDQGGVVCFPCDDSFRLLDQARLILDREASFALLDERLRGMLHLLVDLVLGFHVEAVDVLEACTFFDTLARCHDRSRAVRTLWGPEHE